MAEPSRLVIIVEGDLDRHLVRRAVCSVADNVECYRIDELEVELDDEFREYGGNKGRVATLSKNLSQNGPQRNFFGLVDRDVDGLVIPLLAAPGLVYTTFANIVACIFNKDDLRSIAADCFGIDADDYFLSEVLSFSTKLFFLFAFKEKLYSGTSLPSFKKSVRRTADGGFDWSGYLTKVRNDIHFHCEVGIIDQFLDEIPRAGDLRLNMRDHDTDAYYFALLCKEYGLKRVTEQEVWRHLIAAIIRSSASPDFPPLIERASELEAA